MPRTRRGGRQPQPPPEPAALDVVKAAVAADPAREERFKKYEAMWGIYRLPEKTVRVRGQERGSAGNS